MMFPTPYPIAASRATASGPPAIAPVQPPTSPDALRRDDGEAPLIVEPSSPHYVPRGFSNDPESATGSPLLLGGERPHGFDAFDLSTSDTAAAVAPPASLSSTLGAAATAGVAPTVQSTFSLPPLLVVCLVRHVSKDGEVLSTPSSVEQVVRDLQVFFTTPVAAEQIHRNKNVPGVPSFMNSAAAGLSVGGNTTTTSPLMAAGSPLTAVANAISSSSLQGSSAGASSGGSGNTTMNVGGSATGNSGGNHGSAGASSSSRDQYHTALKGSRVSLQFGKAVDPYSTGGSAILSLFVYAVDEPSSRPRRMAQVAREWREHLSSASGSGGGSVSCMVLLYHRDLVAAAMARGAAVDTARVEAAAATLESYYAELRTLGFRPQQMAAYHPQETPVRLLERLRTACAERGDRLCAIYESYHKAKRGGGVGGALLAGIPSPVLPPSVALPAPVQQPYNRQQQQQQSAAAALPGPWNVQQFWRLGYDYVLHLLQFGLVAEAERVLQRLYLEYYNNSDDYALVMHPATLERLGRITNLFDPRRSGTEPGKTGYPKALEATAEPIDGLLLLAAADMACWALLGNVPRCRARYETLIQVCREKFAEEPEDENNVDSLVVSDSNSTAMPICGAPGRRHIPRVLQQFFLLQCFLSGLRTFWPLYGLSTPPPLTFQHPAAIPTAVAAAAFSTATSTTAPASQPGKAVPTPTLPAGTPSLKRTLIPLEPDRRSSGDGGVGETREPSSLSAAALSFSIIGAPDGFVAMTSPLLSEVAQARAAAASETAGSHMDHSSINANVRGSSFASVVKDSWTLPETLRQMLRLNVVEEEKARPRKGRENNAENTSTTTTAASLPRSLELARLAFESGSDAVGESISYLVRLAQGVGFLPSADVPIVLGNRVPPRTLRTVQAHCVHIADLAVSARDCLSFIVDAIGLSVEPAVGAGGTAGVFSGGIAKGDVSPGVPHSPHPAGVEPHCTNLKAPADAATQQQQQQQRAEDRFVPLREYFRNVKELQSADSATRFWRLLTVMAGVAVRVAGQHRREFNLFTRLALTYLSEDPASTMHIVARRLVPFIRGKGWWHLELFVRRLYVEGADHLITLVDAHTRGTTRSQHSHVWRLLFANETAYALYRECLLYLLHADARTTAADATRGGHHPDADGSSDVSSHDNTGPVVVDLPGFEVGSLDSRAFARRSREELWRQLLSVDALVEEPLFGEHPPEYPLEALATDLRMEVRPAAARAISQTDAEGTIDASVPKFSDNFSTGLLRVALDDVVRLTFTCRCPVDVLPSLPDRRTTIRAVLESRRDWDDDAGEPTHVVALADGDAQYDAVSRTLTANFAFLPCHAGLYRLRSVGLRNGATRLSYYPRRVDYSAAATGAAVAMVGALPGSLGGTDSACFDCTGPVSSPTSPAGASIGAFVGTHNPHTGHANLSQHYNGCSNSASNSCGRMLFHVPEPVSGIRLRVSPPQEEHCFADAPAAFTLHVEMKQPLVALARRPAAGAAAVTGSGGATANTSNTAAGFTRALLCAGGDAKRAAAAATFSDAATSSSDEDGEGTQPICGATSIDALTTGPTSARSIVQERMKKSAKAAPERVGNPASSRDTTTVARRECLFEASPASLTASLPLTHAGGLGASLSGSHRALTLAGVGAAATLSLPSLSLFLGGANAAAAAPAAGGGVGLDGSCSGQGGEAGVVAVVQVTPPKARTRLGQTLSGTPAGGPNCGNSVGGSAGGASVTFGVGGGGMGSRAASPTLAYARSADGERQAPTGESVGQLYSTGVVVEFGPDTATYSPGASFSFGGGGAAGGVLPSASAELSGCRWRSPHHAHVRTARQPHGCSGGAVVDGAARGRSVDVDSLSATRRSHGGERFTPLALGATGVGRVSGAGITTAAAAGGDGVRLALHPATRLCCTGESFTPVGGLDATTPTQVRVSISGHAHTPDERTHYGGDVGVPMEQAQGEDEDPDGDGASYGAGPLLVPGAGAAAGGLLPRTIIPLDEATVMSVLKRPTADTHTGNPQPLPLRVSGTVSIFPRRECTFHLAVDGCAAGLEGNDDASGNGNSPLDANSTPSTAVTAPSHIIAHSDRMQLHLPLLPLFVTCERRRSSSRANATVTVARGGNDNANIDSATNDQDDDSETPKSTVSFSCLRGRESCTSSVAISFPFSQAISVSFAFRHFQARVYCHVTLTNELTRTSLWLRGVLLNILDRMPTYEVVRVSDSYNNLLHREWKPRESLSLVFELALCRSFQPMEAVLWHRVRVQAFYSDWHRTYTRTPAAHRIVLTPVQLPETEAGAESVRIEAGSVAGGGTGDFSLPGVPATMADVDGTGPRVDAATSAASTTSAETTYSPVLGETGRELTQAPVGSLLGRSFGSPGAPAGAKERPAAATVGVPYEVSPTTGSTGEISTTTTSSTPRGRRVGVDADDSDGGDGDRSMDDIGRAVRFNPVFLSLLSAMCNTFVSQAATFRSKHLCLFSAIMYAESPWRTRFGAATNYASANSWAGQRGLGAPRRTLSWDANSSQSRGGVDTDDAILMADAMVDQPSDFRFVAGEPVRFRVRLEPSAHNWPEEAGIEEDFFIQLQYDPTQWMVIGKQRERRTLSLMEDVTVNFTAVPLLPPTAASTTATGGGGNGEAVGGAESTSAAPAAALPETESMEKRVRLAGNSVQDEGVLRTPTIKVFWANPSPETGRDRGQVLVDVVRFRTMVKVYKKVR